MKIDPLVHYCVVQSGPAAGNKARTEVNRWNYNDRCEYCDEQLASIEELTLHIYEELTT